MSERSNSSNREQGGKFGGWSVYAEVHDRFIDPVKRLRIAMARQ